MPRRQRPLSAGARTLTNGDLDEQANQVAARLLNLGAGQDCTVGVLLPHGIDLAVAECAVLKTGAAFLLLDPAHPGDQLASIGDDAGTSIIVTTERYVSQVPAHHQIVCLDTFIPADGPALPSTDTSPAVQIPPATPTERIVADIWCEVLRLPSVSVLDNFFDLGGHSMLLYRMKDRLAETAGASLGLIEFFEHPTVRALARRIDGDTKIDAQDHDNRRSGRSRLELQRARSTRIADSGKGSQLMSEAPDDEAAM